MATGTSFDHFKLIKNHLECGICQDIYNQPKSLDCQHSFCESCLETYHEGRYAGARKIHCPMCRQETPLPETGVQGLKTNFNLTNMLEDIWQQGTKKTTNLSRCGKHKGMVKLLFCETCEKLICQKCADSDHAQHRCIGKETASFERRQLLKGLFSPLDKNIDECQQALSTASEAKFEFASGIKQTTQEVQNRAFQNQSVITRREEQLLNEIKKVEKKYIESYDHHEKTVKELLQKAQHSLETAKKKIDVAAEDDFLSFYPEVREDLRQWKVFPKVDLRLPNITFKGTISGVKDAGKSIGTVMLRTWEKCSEFGDFQSACDVASMGNSQPDELAVVNCSSQNGMVGIYTSTGYCKKQHLMKGIFSSKTYSPSGIGLLNNRLIVPCCPHQYVWTLQHQSLASDPWATSGFYTFEHFQTSHKDECCRFIATGLSTYFVQTASPRSVAVKSNGTIVIGDVLRNVLTEHQIKRMYFGHRSTDIGVLLRTIKLGITPHFLAVGNANNIFVVSDSRKATVVKDDGTAEFSIKPAIRGIPEEQTTCTGVCCDSSGIYLAMHGEEKGTGHIHHYSARGQFLSCIVQELYQPMGITIVADGQKLAVADTKTVKVYRNVSDVQPWRKE